MTNLRSLSASGWTRLLLTALAITLFGLVICAFLAAILNAGGDAVGHRVFSVFNIGLATFVAAECVALVALVAVRLEWPASAD